MMTLNINWVLSECSVYTYVRHSPIKCFSKCTSAYEIFLMDFFFYVINFFSFEPLYQRCPRLEQKN
ncbi:hypothetical protein BpHYR1_034403 [Brachionus plicatilis]|uniref:Uncharacterized protein n=1 Tax=Brachionus plicatilis TaxID=10195 RepID=A0A3M7SVY4_BRAPC|nr:hypothetical protein BpHYR1_034403 [Brachionus plicatilis]